MTRPTKTRAERARAFIRTGRHAVAAEIVALPYGAALITPELPDWRDCNAIYVERDAGDLDAATLTADSDRLLTGLPEPQIRIEVPAVAARVSADLAAAGWARRSGIYMAFEGAPPVAEDKRVEQVQHARLRPLRTEWLRSELPLETAVQHGLVADDRAFAQYPLRAFGGFGPDGRLAAMTLLLGADAPTMMVEDVYTTPAARGTGLGAALVQRAVRTALDEGADLIFLPTESEGRARALYERLGFTVLAEDISFVRGG
ncbi:MAG: hypothetical protein QOF76_1364 [Solirubrobacteraceae bacterium]|nr:hypothetical protein [Solirubrobacteraceae bacterium]